jgi:two-component system cell cycle sensor histidine kinase/response regulator CckA
LAKILIVDDNPSNRSLLVQFLSYIGHSVREAVDGAEALALISSERPDLVITDILMPTMDGYELVRRLRSAGDIAHTPVIFWTAHFRERDARDLAKECGVEYVLTKPCDLETVRIAVDTCLSQTRPAVVPPVAESFDREHMRLLMDKLTKQTDELTAVNLRLEALVDTSLRLASETDSKRLLEEFGKSARELVSAKYVLVGIVKDGNTFENLSVAGTAPGNSPIFTDPQRAYQVISALLPGAPQTRRIANLGGDPAVLGFPKDHPSFASLLAAPISSPGRFHGWLCLFHRLGALEFSQEDERLAGILGALAGRIYENGQLYANAQQHAAELEREVAVRTRAEEALRSSEARYRLFFEDNPLPGWLFDLKSLRFLDVNRAAVEHYGYSREEFLSMTLVDIRPKSEVATLLQNASGLAAGAGHRGRRKHRKKNGDTIDVEIISHVLEGADPAVFTLAHDVTERLRGEAEIRETTQRLNLALAASRTGVWTWDAVNDHMVWDANTHQIHAIAPGEFGGKFADFVAVIHPEDRDKIVQGVSSASQGPADLAVEFRTVWPDNSVHFIAARGRAFFDEAGNLVRVTGVSQDVTEQRKLTEQLRQAQKMEAIGQLAGGIAHDFNNVLNVILGYSKLLLSNSTPHDPAYRRLDEIRKAGERAAALTQQLLAFSRQQVLQPRVINLADTLTEMEQMVQRIIGDHIRVNTQVEEGLGQVKIDPTQAHQVILNLVVNARDAMPNGGTLTMEVSNTELDESSAHVHGLSSGRYVMLAVSDNGSGMTPEVRQRVFEPFFTTKGTGQGTGLGLATVYGIVQQSGGHIWLYSEPGIGTTFKIFLPRVDEPQETQVTEPAQQIARGEETVLVVEDDPAVRGLVEEILRPVGYQVIIAENGEAAIRAAEAFKGTIHLLVTDVVMPVMGGREVADRLTVLRPGIKVLFMSGYTGNAIAQHGTLDPDVAFIQKPFTPEALCAKVRAALATKPRIRRVLVVDDDTSLRNLLVETLEGAGFQAFAAENGKAARAEAAKNPVELIITDLAMPEEEGLEMIRLLQKEQPQIKIVAMSGAFEPAVLKAARYLGAHATLPKPLSLDGLLQCIGELEVSTH